MARFRILTLAVIALSASGCVTAQYDYSVEVPEATAQSPAVVEVHWKGGGRTVTVPAADASHSPATGTEVMQIPGSVFIDVPRGLEVRVTRDGFKPWEHRYRFADEDFYSPRWDTFVRRDVVHLEPVGSDGQSVIVTGAPMYP